MKTSESLWFNSMFLEGGGKVYLYFIQLHYQVTCHRDKNACIRTKLRSLWTNLTKHLQMTFSTNSLKLLFSAHPAEMQLQLNMVGAHSGVVFTV